MLVAAPASVVAAAAITGLQDRLQQLGTHKELLGFDLPVQLPQVFSIGAIGAILIVVMLCFPRGLLAGSRSSGDGREHRSSRRMFWPYYLLRSISQGGRVITKGNGRCV